MFFKSFVAHKKNHESAIDIARNHFILDDTTLNNDILTLFLENQDLFLHLKNTQVFLKSDLAN